MSQQAIPERKLKKKAGKKLEFDAGKTFDVKPAEEIELDQEASQYHAQKGQGGDRRS